MATKTRQIDDDPADSLLRLLARAQSAVRTRVATRLEGTGVAGLRPSHAAVLHLIDESGSRITPLADRAGVTKQAMGQFIDDLEAKGLVAVVSDGADKRARVVRLTDAGASAAREAARSEAAVTSEIADEMGKGRYRRLRKRLSQIAALGSPNGSESASQTSDS
jgi:DNA-binding MarR family transcriptional regulator